MTVHVAMVRSQGTSYGEEHLLRDLPMPHYVIATQVHSGGPVQFLATISKILMSNRCYRRIRRDRVRCVARVYEVDASKPSSAPLYFLSLLL